MTDILILSAPFTATALIVLALALIGRIFNIKSINHALKF